jgi:LysM repeat protein
MAAFLAFGALFILLACLPIAWIAGIYQYYQASGRIVPGVCVGDIPLAGMTGDEAAVFLEETWEVGTQITVTNGLVSRTVSPAELGLHADAMKTAVDAQTVAHVGSALGRSAQMFASWKDGFAIAPILELDEAAARSKLEALSAEMSLPAKDATLRLEGGEIIAVPSEIGYTINMDETLLALKANPQAVLSGKVLQVILMPVLPRVTDASGAMAQAQRLLDTTLVIRGYDPISDEHQDWAVERQTVGGWLKVVPGESAPQVALDEAKVGTYLASLSKSLEPRRYLDLAGASAPLAAGTGNPLLVTIRHHPTTYTVQPGDTLLKISWNNGIPGWLIQQENPGLNPDALQAGQELKMPSKDKLLPRPVVANKRVVIDLSGQRLRAFQDGGLVNNYVISTGIDRSPTQPGVFQVQSHVPNAYASIWDLHMPNFLGIYEAWPGFMNGIHGLPILSNGRRLWGNILGRPASYGCIILDTRAAEWLYHWAEDGVVVEIRP